MARVRLALVALVLAAAAPLGAQEISPAAPAIASTSSSISLIAQAPSTSAQVANVTSSGPTLDAARAGFHAPLATGAAPAGATRAGLGQARAMMIVGGAAILAGAIIGHDAGAFIMVGGAVIGLVGLYEYLQ